MNHDQASLTMCNVTQDLSDFAATSPDSIALIAADRALTAAQLDEAVWHLAAALTKTGVKQAEPVLIRASDQTKTAIAMLALMRIGAVCVIISPTTSEAALADQIVQVGSKHMLSDMQQTAPHDVQHLGVDALIAQGADLPRPEMSDAADVPCLILFGSGSTGAPRLIAITHRQMLLRNQTRRKVSDIRTGDRIMSLSRLGYLSPIVSVLDAIAVHGSYVIWEEGANALSEITKHRPDAVRFGVLQVEQLLTEAGYAGGADLSFVRMMRCTGSLVSDGLRRRFIEGLSANLQVLYASNELDGITMAPTDVCLTEEGTVGWPTDGVELEIVDGQGTVLGAGEVGEIRARTPGMMTEYFGGGDEDRFQDGWFYPRDLGRLTEDGQLVHLGRADQMMIMNGVNIFPAEIEQVLGRHPDVRDMAAFPLIHAVSQEIPVCAVTLAEGSQVSRTELLKFAENLLGNRGPAFVAVLAKIPRNAQGKVIRAELEAEVRAALQSHLSSRDRRQHSANIRLRYRLPETFDAQQLAQWRGLIEPRDVAALARLDVDGEAVPLGFAQTEPQLALWVQQLLGLVQDIMHAAHIPSFATPKLMHCAPLAENESTRDLLFSLPLIDMVPDPQRSEFLAKSFDLATDLARTPITPKTREDVFERLSQHFVTPLTRMTPPGKSTMRVLRAAFERGTPFMHLGAGVYQLGWGSKARRIDRSSTFRDPAQAIKLTQNKATTSALLRYAGLPAPEHMPVKSLESAQAAAAKLGWPVVVKPADLDRGEGVFVDLDAATLPAAFEAASKASPSGQVLVEKQVSGYCHRVFVSAGQMLYAVRRLPMGVYADGVSTVTELVDVALEAEAARAPWTRSELLPLDVVADHSLQQAGLTRDSVRAKGVFVALRRIETTAAGGVDEDVSGEIHPDNIAVALKAAALCGLDVAGVDIICSDISQPWHQTDAIINEVNFAPLLGVGPISKTHVGAHLDRLLVGRGCIPVHVFVGDNAALEAAKAAQSKLSQNGVDAHIVAAQETITCGGQVLATRATTASSRLRALMVDPSVEAVILVIQDDAMLQSGLPIEGVDTLQVVNSNITFSQGANLGARQRAFGAMLQKWTWAASPYR